MIFRILEKKYANEINLNNDLKRVYSNENYFIDIDKDYKLFEYKNKEIIVIGEMYHIKTKEKVCDKDLEVLLSESFCNDIPRLFHGRYIVILIDHDAIRIIQDGFSRYDVYYTVDKAMIAVASELSLLPIDKKNQGYDQNALAQMLISYGNRPCKKQTIYKSVKRLGVLEAIFLDANGLSVEIDGFKPRAMRKYTKSDNETYCDLFLETIEREGSRDGNLVYLSSGWDSTSILAGLVHVFGSDKVHVLTGRMKYSKRSGICNAIEMKKVEKFAEFYKVKNEIVDFDYAENGIELVNSAIPMMRKHGYYNITAVNHWALANAAKKIICNTEQVVFAGEISDGVHNFGYSQYATIFHPSYGFREYADKMASYLFGPTFLKRIIDGDYKDDPIYKLFYSNPNFIVDEARNNEKEIKEQLLIDFFLRNGRRPFWSSRNIGMLTDVGIKRYTGYHFSEYLSAVGELEPDNLYSYYLHLYNSFHWQASTVAPLQNMTDEHGLRSSLPFWDKHLQEFLSTMPEEWGRGLDLNNTKYPLKWMLENRLNYPIDLQEGPHSYTYDIDHSFNHYEEILRQSSLSADVFHVLESFNFEGVLGAKCFDMAYIDSLKSSFLKGEKLSGAKLNEVASLYFLAKVN